MRIDKIPPYKKGLLNVIIETPKGAQQKFTYEPELGLFKLKKSLPMGTVFPFDFGFIPNTSGEDGDPLDVLVIMDEPAYPGCFVECRLLGVLKAKQTEKRKKAVRNDRFIAVAECSILYGSIQDIKDLNKNMVAEIENFFIDYNKHEGKVFMPVTWTSAKKAVKMIRKATPPALF
ncbi:MAG: inorganic diphosphatase [Flavipsychrobacter sp.]|nr:inorganic diphosphatase [Flavipsychrobacter sp.]